MEVIIFLFLRYPKVQPELERRVRPRPDDILKDPEMIPEEKEVIPMDMYNRAMRRYQDNIGRGLNYQHMHTNLLFQNMQINRLEGYPTSCAYIPS